jgi:hypothetical protein
VRATSRENETQERVSESASEVRVNEHHSHLNKSESQERVNGSASEVSVSEHDIRESEPTESVIYERVLEKLAATEIPQSVKVTL